MLCARGWVGTDYGRQAPVHYQPCTTIADPAVIVAGNKLLVQFAPTVLDQVKCGRVTLSIRRWSVRDDAVWLLGVVPVRAR